MNYIRDLHDNIEDLFKDFVDDIIELPFNSLYSPEYNLNQNIVNRIYNIRRTIELYPDNEYYDEINAYENDDSIDITHNNFNETEITTEWSSEVPFNISLNSQMENNMDFELFNSIFDILDQSLENTLNNLEDVKITLSDEEFNKLEIPDDISILKNKQCNICLEDLLEENDYSNIKTLTKLKCNHIYHRCCIKTWLTKQSTKCPVCRTCCRTST
jgi:hypothetical protein